MAPFVFPDILVLAGGGTVGHAWMSGVLAGIEDGADVDFRRVEAFVGTSAGSIVAARLAAGRPPRRPAEPPAEVTGEAPRDSDRSVLGTAARWGWAATAPLAPVAVALSAPAGALVRSALLARAPGGGRALGDLQERVRAWGARFDGRLRVCCVDKRSGRRVVFGAPGAPSAPVAEGVAASCSIPWVFAPVRIGEREYVDGGVWSVTNLDAAPARRDTQVLCLDPTAALRGGALLQAFRVAAAVEIQLLRSRGARVRHIGPDDEAAAAMGTDYLADSGAAPAHAAGYRQGRTLTLTASGDE